MKLRRVTLPLLACALLGTAALVPAEAGGHGGGHSSHGHYGSHHHSSFSLGLGFGLPYYAPAYYYPPYYAPLAYAPAYGPRDRGDYGQIETNVRPQKATVYLDGEPVGIADDFDGWPAKLWVRPGSHELVFREPGYRPYRVSVEVMPFHSVKIERRLEHGVDEEVAPPVRLQSQGRVESPYEAPRGRHQPAGVLSLSLEPADAKLFVDGRRVAGSGSFTLDLEPGSHHLEAIQPGFERFAGEVVLREGQRQELSIHLTPVGATGSVGAP